MKRIALILLLLLASAQGVLASYDCYSPIPIDHTLVSGTQSNFTHLAYYTDARLKDVAHGGKVNNSSGFDLRPFSDSACTSALTYQLIFYDPAAGTVEMAILRSSINGSSDTAGYLCYKNVSISTDGSSTSAWDSNTKGMWLFPNPSSLTLTDFTVNANNGTNHSGTATAGQVGGGLALSGSSQYVDVGNGSSLQNTEPISIYAWVHPTDRANYYWIFAKTQSNIPAPYEYRLDTTTGLPHFSEGDGAISQDHIGSSAPSTGIWSMVGVTSTATAIITNDVEQYLNGSTNGGNASNAHSIPADQGTHALIGTRDDLFAYFKGILDLIRFDSVVRAASWMATWYNDTLAPATFAPLGAQVCTNSVVQRRTVDSPRTGTRTVQ